MITVKSKDSLMNLIMSRPNSEDETMESYEPSSQDDSVIIINATEILDVVRKKKLMEKVSDLSTHFLLELAISN